MVKAVEAQGHRIERIEGAIEGLHRVLTDLAASVATVAASGGDKPMGRWAAVKAAHDSSQEVTAAWPTVVAPPTRQNGGGYGDRGGGGGGGGANNRYGSPPDNRGGRERYLGEPRPHGNEDYGVDALNRDDRSTDARELRYAQQGSGWGGSGARGGAGGRRGVNPAALRKAL